MAAVVLKNASGITLHNSFMPCDVSTTELLMDVSPGGNKETRWMFVFG